MEISEECLSKTVTGSDQSGFSYKVRLQDLIKFTESHYPLGTEVNLPRSDRPPCYQEHSNNLSRRPGLNDRTRNRTKKENVYLEKTHCWAKEDKSASHVKII